jgi:hypothetical protein
MFSKKRNTCRRDKFMICTFVEEVLTICLTAAKWSTENYRKTPENETVQNGRR